MFQDGALRFNNPLEVGCCESRYIWPEASTDVLVSLGTGTTEVEQCKPAFKATQMPRALHLLCHGFIPRTFKGVQSAFDGERTWISYKNRLTSSKSQDFRLNIDLEEAPAIDDLDCLERLKKNVHTQPGGAIQRLEVAVALLSASFFFELEAVPKIDSTSGRFRCDGTIYCRNTGAAVVESLQRLCGESLSFSSDDGSLAGFGIDAICDQCFRFSKRVSFLIDDLSQPSSLYLTSPLYPQQRISGFPQSMNWFIAQQGLHLEFGDPSIFRPSKGNCRCRSRIVKRESNAVNSLPSKRQKRGESKRRHKIMQGPLVPMST